MNDSNETSIPPALPKQCATEPSFAATYEPVPGKLTLHALLERLLKAPDSLAYELTRGRRLGTCLFLALIAGLCFMGYGFIMGAFSAGEQLVMVPVKMLAGILLSAAICLPSLYIFACFSGGRQSLGDTIGLFTLGLALWSILLVGFAPIAWLFAQSTESLAFMGLLHLVFWVTAACFGLSLMNRALAHLNGRHLAILPAWGVIFLIVTMQVATLFRPLIGKAESPQWGAKKFFLAHWSDCIDSGDHVRR